MNDPYKVLNIPQTATDDEVKHAYRELARKYHPDNYHDNPLADLAQEKMKEINEAYDTIVKQRAGGGGSTYSAGNTGTGGYGGASSEFAAVRNAINAGNIAYAEQLLNSSSNRNAEWNFLMGSVCYRKGWLDEARRYYQTAVSMDPGNAEYRQALNFMASGGSEYYRSAARSSGGGMSACDCCCECMGGDLIPCC